MSLCFSFFRWRVNRVSILTDAQWNTAKKIFREYAVKFFQGENDMIPQFVALNNDVIMQMVDLLAEVAEPRVALPPPVKKPRSVQPPPATAAAAAAPASSGIVAKNKTAIDMDGEQKEEKFEKEDDRDIHWEIEAWFDRDHGARFLMWDNKESQPSVQWPQLQLTFPRLSLLARRFLCVLPSSAPSERVWSGFGHIIDKTSSKIDSTLAAQIMFLRANRDMLDLIPLS
jgi:hAT family C-terminal dimerisation region